MLPCFRFFLGCCLVFFHNHLKLFTKQVPQNDATQMIFATQKNSFCPHQDRVAHHGPDNRWCHSSCFRPGDSVDIASLHLPLVAFWLPSVTFSSGVIVLTHKTKPITTLLHNTTHVQNFPLFLSNQMPHVTI